MIAQLKDHMQRQRIGTVLYIIKNKSKGIAMNYRQMIPSQETQ